MRHVTFVTARDVCALIYQTLIVLLNSVKSTCYVSMVHMMHNAKHTDDVLVKD